MSECKRQKLESIMNNNLTGKALENALDFVNSMITIGYNIEINDTIDFYYMGEITFLVIIAPHSENFPDGYWGIFNYPLNENENFPLDSDLIDFVHQSVRICEGECGCADWPRGGNKVVYGKNFEDVCSSVIQWSTPDAEAVEKIKELMKNWALIIAEKQGAK
ncbi:MAG: hypothetical protein FWE06_09485 [Oscillospiraceae bacterium]|nr:hypothetical protein [Oscillospiraceae bacterium]